jgi:hypothetical protein
MGRIYEVVVDMDSGDMIYRPNFVKIDSRIEKVRGGGHTQTAR